MQAPMAPINMNTQSNADQKVRTPYPDVLTNSTTAMNRQVETNYTGANLVQRDSMENSSRNQESGTVSKNMTSRGVEQSVLDGQTTEIRETNGKMLIWTIGETSTCNIPTLTPGRASFFRTDRMTRDLKTQAKMKLALGVFSQMMAFSQIW